MHITSLSIHRDTFPATDAYPFNLEFLHKTDAITFTSPVTCFVGENGSGKSTLLKAIAHRANIYIWQGFQRSRYKKSRYENDLYRHVSLTWSDREGGVAHSGACNGAFFASEIFKNFSQLLDEWASSDPGVLEYFGNRSLMAQSHGQSHMAYFTHRFNIKGLYLLDEPENALSPKTQLELLDVLKTAMEIGESQIIMATHSPILLSLGGAQILSFDRSPITEVGLRETEQFSVYADFFSKVK